MRSLRLDRGTGDNHTTNNIDENKTQTTNAILYDLHPLHARATRQNSSHTQQDLTLQQFPGDPI